jgi:hypothetical protein
MPFTLLLLANIVSAWYGTVTFFQDVDFKGSEYPYGISQSQRCFQLSCWDNKASSVKWEGLPSSGIYGGKARIAFYTDKYCRGKVRHWPTDIDGYYPEDLTLDSLNDQGTSFMVWETSRIVKNGRERPCPWGTNE